MSIGSIGSDSAQLWQLVRQSQPGGGGQDSPSSFGLPSAAPSTTPNAAGTDPAGGTPTSGAAATIIADLKSLLLTLQGGGATNSATATATTTSSSASTDATSATTGSPASDVLNDLKTLFDDVGKTVGGAHHHGHHGPPPADASDTNTDLTGTGSTATAGATPGQAQPQPDALQRLSSILGTYASQAAGTAASYATSGLTV